MADDGEGTRALGLRAEVLAAAERYARDFRAGHLGAPAARRLAVVTCMDARIDPVRLLGLHVGDAQVIRNAGALATDDVLRSLAVAHWLLGTDRAIVIGHTDCGLGTFTDDDVRARIAAHPGADAGDVEFLAFDDLEESVRESVRRISRSSLLPDSFVAHGFVYEVSTGRVHAVD